MRAIQFEQFGEPADVLKTTEIDTPSAGSGEVLVRMLASPVNPSDLMTIRGNYGILPEPPATPGYEGVGIVEAGNGLLGKLFKGKRCAVLNRTGGNWQEKVVVPAKQVIPLPDALSTAQAAMFFVNPATAWVMTQDVLQVPSGGWLLQTAAASSLGQMVIRLGRSIGFHTINVVRRESQVELLKKQGADHVIVFDSAKETPAQLAEKVRSCVDPEGIQSAIDPVGGATLAGVIASLGIGGRVLSYGTLSSEPTTFSPRDLLTQTAVVQGFWLSRHMQNLGLLSKLKLVGKLKKLITSGVLGAEEHQMFAMDDISDAVRTSEEPGRGAKVVIQIAND